MDARYLTQSRPSYTSSSMRTPAYSTQHSADTYRRSSYQTHSDAADSSQIPHQEFNSSSYQDYPSRRLLLDDQSAPGRSPRNVKAAPESRSRAIMSALRGLQDRIRSLELERSQAENNLKSLATETTQYKDILQRQSTAREVTQTEISKQSQEVQVKLGAAENRCNLLEKQLEYMRKMVQTAEQERQSALHKQDLRESRQAEVSHSDRQERIDKLDELEREHVRLKATQTLAESKIRHLEDKVQEERQQRRLIQQRAAEFQTAAQTNRILLESDARIPTDKTKKTKRKKRKTSAAPGKKKAPSPVRRRSSSQSPTRHYRLNLGQIPFVAGTSTGPSHSVGANLQNVLAIMKTHHPAWCSSNDVVARPVPSIGGRRSRARRSHSLASSTEVSSDSDLSELLLGLQDEFGQMGFEHNELAKQIQETEDVKICEDLERELDEIVLRMEAKGEQIARLKRHKTQATQKKKHRKVPSHKGSKRTVSARTSDSNSTAAEVQVVTTVKTKGKKAPPIRVASAGNVSGGNGRNSRQILRDMQTLQTSLRKDDVSWD